MQKTKPRPVKQVKAELDMPDRYVPDYPKLEALVKKLKRQGRRIVLTQGVYDLFHVGHKRYLEAAKSHGDVLVVGVDSDELTRERKGPKRPFDCFEDRVEVLMSLRAVDIVTVRHVHHHMYDLIKLVKPHVLVMSETTADFTPEDKDKLSVYYEEIRVLPAQASTSTTAKLRKLMVDGAEELGKRVVSVINGFLKNGV